MDANFAVNGTGLFMYLVAWALLMITTKIMKIGERRAEDGYPTSPEGMFRDEHDELLYGPLDDALRNRRDGR